MKLKTLAKIQLVFSTFNWLVILPPFLIGVIFGWLRGACEWLVDILDYRIVVGNKLLKASDEVKNGKIKNKEFIGDSSAWVAYKYIESTKEIEL
jgi:hypothetical protein